MLNISNNLKEKYINGTGDKHLDIYFPDIGFRVSNENIVTNTMSLKESICGNSTIDYKGCVSTEFSISIGNLATDVNGQRVEVHLTLDDDTERIPLFHGYVDSVEKQDTSTIKKITCYDLLYSKLADMNIASWYSSIYYPCTIGQFRKWLFDYLNVEYIETELPADNTNLNMVFNTDEMSALEVIKQICQINAVFGIINRDGVFEFRKPNIKTFDESECAMTLNVIKGIRRYDYTNKIRAINYRDDPDDENQVIQPHLPLEDETMYIVNGNMFILDMMTDYRDDIANKVIQNMYDDIYAPFSVDVPGYPFLEVGDRICIKNIDYSSGTPTEVTTFTNIFTRTLKGLPGLTDTYEASGEIADTIISDGANFTNKVNSSNSVAKNMQYVTYQNLVSDYILEDGRTHELINITYFITRSTHLCIDMEFLIDVDTLETIDGNSYTTNDCTIEFMYYKDGLFIDLEKPIVTSVDGHKLVRLRHDIPAVKTGVYQWQVFCKVTNGTVYIPEKNMICIMNADGLVGDDGWNGNLYVTEEIERLGFNMIGEFTDDGVVTFPTIVGGLATDTMQRVSFALLGGFTDDGITNSDLMIYTAFTNADKLTVNAKLSGGVYSNGTIITDQIYHVRNVETHDYNAIYFVSFDNGVTWLGWSFETNRWIENNTMISSEIENVPEAAWQSPCRIKVLLEDNATFNGLNVYGGSISD